MLILLVQISQPSGLSFTQHGIMGIVFPISSTPRSSFEVPLGKGKSWVAYGNETLHLFAILKGMPARLLQIK